MNKSQKALISEMLDIAQGLYGGFNCSISCEYGSDSLSTGFVDTCKVEGILEVAEVLDCGSVGGFGKDQPRGQTLQERFDWLVEKYGNKL